MKFTIILGVGQDHDLTTLEIEAVSCETTPAGHVVAKDANNQTLGHWAAIGWHRATIEGTGKPPKPGKTT